MGFGAINLLVYTYNGEGPGHGLDAASQFLGDPRWILVQYYRDWIDDRSTVFVFGLPMFVPNRYGN
jgi:hypothetical protein